MSAGARSTMHLDKGILSKEGARRAASVRVQAAVRKKQEAG